MFWRGDGRRAEWSCAASRLIGERFQLLAGPVSGVAAMFALSRGLAPNRRHNFVDLVQQAEDNQGSAADL